MMTFSSLFTDSHAGLGPNVARGGTQVISAPDGTDIGATESKAVADPPRIHGLDGPETDGTCGQEDREDRRPGTSRDAAVRVVHAAAVKVSQEAIDELVAERTELVTQKFRSALSAADERHLRMLEWKLERVEESEIGGALSNMESIVGHYEAFSRRVSDWVEEVKALPPSPSKHRGGRQG